MRRRAGRSAAEQCVGSLSRFIARRGHVYGDDPGIIDEVVCGRFGGSL